ncbi:hypothetical protein, partial [uncultured Thiodictyon sp.]|uniref:hypothetical protein n=1 Tax=uncultured Thiodictyon sp. TaxID=1846217 RepID=UPI0025D466C5
PGLTVSGLEQSGLEALTTPPRTLAIELAVERTFMFRGGAGAMTVSRWLLSTYLKEINGVCTPDRLKPRPPVAGTTIKALRGGTPRLLFYQGR